MEVVAVVTLIVAVLVGVPSVYLAWKQLRKKELSYEVLPSIPVVQFGDAGKQAIGEDWDAVEVRYKGQPVNDVQLVRVRIWNSGNVEIRPEDFYSPIKVKFSGYLLQVGVLEASPPRLREAFLAGGYGGGSGVGPAGASGSATFDSKFLLNQGHSITIKLLLGGFQGTETVSVEADIAGVPKIRRVSRTRPDYARWLIPVMISVFSAALVESQAGKPLLPGASIAIESLLVLVTAVPAMLVLFVLTMPVKRPKHDQ